MSEDLGSAHGSVVINAASALATLAALRRKSAATIGTLNTLGRASITAGTGIAAVGAGIAGVFALAVAKSAEIEKKISYIKGITGIQGKEVDIVREKIIQLGQDSAYTAAEVADGFTELSKAGATTAQLVGGVGDAMITLGQSADISLTDAATALISISSTFNLLPKNAAHIADIMQGAANASIISVEDMAVSFKYAGGVAANLGLTVDETATAIALLGNAGIKGSTAGTSLRRIFLQLTPRTDKAAKAMKKLGIITEDGKNRFYNARGEAKKLSAITEVLRKSTAKLTPEMKQKALATIFGDRAINSAIALSKGGAKAFDNMYKKVGNVKAADVAAERLNNLAGKWEILKGTIDSALIRAGAPAQKPLMQIVVAVTALINRFNALSPKTQELIVRFGLITAAVLLASGGFLIIVGTMFRAVAIMKQLNGVIKLVRLQMTLFLAVQKAANGALLLSPWTWVIIAIIALVAALIFAYKHSERFRAIVQKVVVVLKKAAKAVWEFIQKIPGAVVEAWTATKNFFTRIYRAVAGFITDSVNFVKAHWKIILTLLVAPWSIFILLFWKYKATIWNIVKQIVFGILSFIGSLPGKIGFILGFILGRLIRWGFLLVRFMLKIGYEAVKAIITFWLRLPGRIWNVLVTVLKFLARWAPIVISKARSIGSGFLHGLISFFLKLPGRIWHFLQLAHRKITEWAAIAIDKAIEIGGKLKDGIMSGVKKIPGLIRGALEHAIRVFKDLIKKAFHASKDFAGGLWRGFKKGIMGSPRTKIAYAMEDMGDTVDRELKGLRGQLRTLRAVGSTMTAGDPLVHSPAFRGRSQRPSDGNSTTTHRTMIVNVNNPSRQTVTKSYDRGLKETAYANGWVA